MTREPDPGGFIADLPGFSRGWGVAMDNRHDLAGYKYYTTPDGRRPAAHVAFLDLLESASGQVSATNGVCLPVDERSLVLLDDRERNYRRVDVSDRIGVAGARIWTYIGTEQGRKRLADGVTAGTAIIDGAYLSAVRAGFEALGTAELRAAADSLEPGGLPVAELIRHELSEPTG